MEFPQVFVISLPRVSCKFMNRTFLVILMIPRNIILTKILFVQYVILIDLAYLFVPDYLKEDAIASLVLIIKIPQRQSFPSAILPPMGFTR